MEEFNAEEILDPEGSLPPSKSGVVRFFVDILETVLLSVLLFLGINALTARVRVDGQSMLPTFDSGEFIIVSKITYKLGEPEHGDIVVFHLPRDPDQDYIKRVIGLPGDVVSIHDGKVFLNDDELDEPYLNAPTNYTGDWAIAENSLFVLGDNRNNSSDSHSWGPVPMEYVIGKAVFVYWPVSSFGVIEHPTVALAAP